MAVSGAAVVGLKKAPLDSESETAEVGASGEKTESESDSAPDSGATGGGGYMLC